MWSKHAAGSSASGERTKHGIEILESPRKPPPAPALPLAPSPSTLRLSLPPRPDEILVGLVLNDTRSLQDVAERKSLDREDIFLVFAKYSKAYVKYLRGITQTTTESMRLREYGPWT
jgi:hypothetical protein